MKYKVLNLGTIRVNAFQMVMGLPEELIRSFYNVDPDGSIRIAMNGLIVETGEKIIVIDPGTATFLSASLAETYDLQMDYTLEETVAKTGYHVEQVTDVVFTHLHFDHGSGAFKRVPGGIIKIFPNARYVVSKTHMEAISLMDHGEAGDYFHKLLRFAGNIAYAENWKAERIRFIVSHGHTPNMLIPVLDCGDREVLFATDLIPMKLLLEEGASSFYDADKNLIQEERKEILSQLSAGAEIIYYHDPG